MLPIPQEIQESIFSTIGQSIVHFSFSGGGCINHGGKIETTNGTYFLKWNDLQKFPEMFSAEARGLSLLANSGTLHTPEVISAGATSNYQYLILEFIESRARDQSFWSHFGIGLANLHSHSDEFFGLDHDNYIGSLRQCNCSYKNWIDFFVEQRLQPQLLMCEAAGYPDNGHMRQFEALCKKLPDLLAMEKPALVHGDLWSGNVIPDEFGLPCLIDPAVYYGNREVDLAMTTLFGGFDSSFLKSYQEVFPLQPGYQRRFQLYNLYPLLVHANLFGGSYWLQVVSILNQFV
jgi:protein-ribulosamine 3-kinase